MKSKKTLLKTIVSKGIIPIVLLLWISSCSEYQSALKSTNIKDKYEVGVKFYEAEKYNKANKLFAQIITQYRGKPQAEKLMYMYANSFYMMGDYSLANYQFDRFVNNFGKSEKLQDASFLAAKSLYLQTPRYSNDQSGTQKAINGLQSFINGFPETVHLEEANKMIKELDYKLEKKAFEIAKQYLRIYRYKASIKSFNNFLLDFPGTSFREEAMYRRMEAAYYLAINSIEYIKEKRLKEALDYYDGFRKYYPESTFIEDAHEYKDEMQKLLHSE